MVTSTDRAVPGPPEPGRRPDGCPGAWRRHEAADGALARFRLVGGTFTAAELQALASATRPDTPLELTSRGSVQVRALTIDAADALADTLRGLATGPAAVLDDRGRELPCSLVASPRATALDDTIGTVATGLRGRTDVPGRVLVALDDGTGDVAGLGADVTVLAPSGALHLDGADTGLRAPDAAALALAAVDAFTAVRDGAWRVAEIPDGVAAVTAGVRDRIATVAGTPGPAPAPPPRLRPGVGDDGVLEVLPRLGELDRAAATALARETENGGLRVTPWRTLVLRGLSDPHATAARLAAAGLETAPSTPWAGLSACVGAPRCAKSHADVRADLTQAVRTGQAGGGEVAAHWVGCARACGTPGGPVAVVEATGITGPGAYRTVVRPGRVSR